MLTSDSHHGLWHRFPQTIMKIPIHPIAICLPTANTCSSLLQPFIGRLCAAAVVSLAAHISVIDLFPFPITHFSMVKSKSTVAWVTKFGQVMCWAILIYIPMHVQSWLLCSSESSISDIHFPSHSLASLQEFAYAFCSKSNICIYWTSTKCCKQAFFFLNQTNKKKSY